MTKQKNNLCTYTEKLGDETCRTARMNTRRLTDRRRQPFQNKSALTKHNTSSDADGTKRQRLGIQHGEHIGEYLE